ncbi:DUF2911 domain-containing protein [Salegentibacter chungangensis]|uniref:DUF2911 domain-containing protein n=1 Tax=Salegentibacter chungangensis TaxID=1335724 RepID=A0ABW3NS31_9FLAO
MKRIIIAALSLMTLMGVNEAYAQEEPARSPNFAKLDASPMDLVLYRNQDNQPVARIIYSRPQKRDREIFGKLVPYGEIWRTGANEATELTLYQDMKVADATINAGNYTLYTIPKEKEWTIILNKKTHTWGAYEYSEEEDVVRINVPVRETSNTIEALSMAFERAEDGSGANLLIGWDDRYVKVPFKTVK